MSDAALAKEDYEPAHCRRCGLVIPDDLKLSSDERRAALDRALLEVQACFPVRELVTCMMAPDAKAEVRVTRMPKSVKEIDVILATLKATRTAFLRGHHGG